MRSENMATRAERYRYLQERSGPKQPKQPPRQRRDDPVDTAQPGVSATDRKARGNATGTRNRSKSAARKAPYQLEPMAGPGRPPRKSTRRSVNKIKPGGPLWNKKMRETTAPSERARRGR
jgi:hypothetical protein